VGGCRTKNKKYKGYVVMQLVEALHYKPEGHWFGSLCGHWDVSLT